MHDTARRGRLSPKTSIEDEIARLRDLDLKALRIRWRNAFGKPAPEHLTRYLLFRIIAYRLQADRLGDLDAETLKVLKQAAGQEGPASAVSKTLARLDQRRFAPPPAVLVREWDRFAIMGYLLTAAKLLKLWQVCLLACVDVCYCAPMF